MPAGAIYLPLWVVPAIFEAFLLIYFAVDGYRARKRRAAHRARLRRRRLYEDYVPPRAFRP